MPDKLSEILIIKESFWKKLAVYIKQWIWRDMLKGEVQAYIPQKKHTVGGAKHYSDLYAYYKSKSMKRDTDSKRLGSPKTLKSGKVKKYKNDRYSGVSLLTQNKTVDMLLTQKTIRGLQYDSSTSDSMTMKYRGADADKILGNEEWGRDIRTLNDENFNSALNMIEEEMGESILDWENQPVIVKIEI